MFGAHIGIDYSGATTPIARNRGLRVCRATRATDPVLIKSPAGEKRHWTRKEIAEWCLEQLKSIEPVIIGIDHGFSFPLGYMERYTISSWDQFLDDFQQHWPTDKDNVTAESLHKGNKRIGRHTEFRLTEKWTASVQSVFKLDGAGTVGKSTHCGIPWLRFIRQNADPASRPHFWPFDGFDIPQNQSVIVEIFPSILRKRYPKRYNTTDAHDAMCVAQWLKDMDTGGHLTTYFNPPLIAEEREMAKLEGWILDIVDRFNAAYRCVF